MNNELLKECINLIYQWFDEMESICVPNVKATMNHLPQDEIFNVIDKKTAKFKFLEGNAHLIYYLDDQRKESVYENLERRYNKYQEKNNKKLIPFSIVYENIVTHKN